MKINYVFQNKKVKSGTDLHFASLFNVHLDRRQWIFKTACVFSLLRSAA